MVSSVQSDMPMKQFTDLGVKRLKTTGKRYHVTEGGGLYLIVNAGGAKSWASYYRAPDGKRRWHPLGDLHTVDLATAREKNREVQEMAKKGIDPEAAGEGLGVDPTMEEVYKLFIKKGVDRKGKPLRASTIEGYKQAFDADILPFLGKRRIRELRKRDIIPVLERIVDRGAVNQANQVYRRLQRVMSFAAARDIIEFNPMQSMEPIGEQNRGSRVLSDAEIKTFLEWKPRSDQARRILRLILTTGSRPGEVSGMCWEEIDGDWWTIRAERVKTGIPHRVYLTATAKALLPERPKDDDGKPANGPVFSVPRDAACHCLGRALKSKAEVPEKKIVGGQPSPLHLAKFVPHDLRRTMATGLAALGFSDEVINAVQGRAKLGIIGTYNLHTYDKERQTAAEAWERKLKGITSGTTDNVVPLVKKA